MVSGGFVQKTSNVAHENISVDTKNAIPLKIPQDARTEMVSDGLVKKLQTVDTKNASPLKTFPKCGAFQLWNDFCQIKNRHNQTRTTSAFGKTRAPFQKARQSKRESYQVQGDSIFQFQTKPSRTIIRTSGGGSVYRLLF